MNEKGESFSPAEYEDKKEESEVSNSKEGPLTSSEELKSLLARSESIINHSIATEKNIDQLIEERQAITSRIPEIELNKEARLNRVEGFNPLQNLNAEDYDRLINEEIIDQEYAEILKSLDNLIRLGETESSPTLELSAQLEALSEQKNMAREVIEDKIAEKQEEIEIRRNEVRERVVEHYSKRIIQLEQRLAEIESNPQVFEKVQKIHEEEQRQLELEQEELHKEIFKYSDRGIRSLFDRYNNALSKIETVLGDKSIIDRLIESRDSGNQQETRQLFDSVRQQLVRAVREGEGEQQITKPQEVVPWAVNITIFKHNDVFNYVTSEESKKVLQSEADAGNQKAKTLLEQLSLIEEHNEILKILIQSKWNKRNPEQMNDFWRAFIEREKDDQSGLTERRKKEKEEKEIERAEFLQSAQEIIDRGGFLVKVPVFKEAFGKKSEVVGHRDEAILLEKFVSTKGNECWKVVDGLGEESESLARAGRTANLQMSQFPAWLKKAAEAHYLRLEVEKTE